MGALLLFSGPAFAEDFVTVSKRLSDDEFYRAVACGASPGGACREPMRRWPNALACELSVSIRFRALAYPDWLYAAVTSALDASIDEINEVGAGVTLTRVEDGAAAEIMIYLPLTRTGSIVQGSGDTPPDGELMDSAFFMLSDDGEGWLSKSFVVLPRDMSEFRVHSVVLEELTQSLGLPYDISGQPYAFASIFDEDGDALKELSRQDKAALRLHYPSAEPCAIAGYDSLTTDQDHRT